jgi:hypothetical protein
MNVGRSELLSTSDIKLEKLPIGNMRVDREVQRSLDSGRAADMANNFNAAGFGFITISIRKDGSVYIVDGQHRVAALRLMGAASDHKVACQVFRGLTQADEAALFRVRNNFKQVRVFDRFRVRVIEGDPVAVILSKTLDNHGWHVHKSGPSKQRAAFNAVSALEWVYNGAGIRRATVHPNAADNTIAIITGAWGHDTTGVRAEIVRGLGLFLVQYGESVDFEKLVTELSHSEGGAGALIGKARNLNSFRGGGVASALAEILVNLHNKGRRTNVLPEWRRSKETTGV